MTGVEKRIPFSRRDLLRNEWVMMGARDSYWQKGFPIARQCLETDAFIQTCCLKTHRFGGHFTLSLKNSVGAVAKSGHGDGYNLAICVDQH